MRAISRSDRRRAFIRGTRGVRGSPGIGRCLQPHAAGSNQVSSPVVRHQPFPETVRAHDVTGTLVPATGFHLSCRLLHNKELCSPLWYMRAPGRQTDGPCRTSGGEPSWRPVSTDGGWRRAGQGRQVLTARAGNACPGQCMRALLLESNTGPCSIPSRGAPR
jgi:hypothetical protein